MTQESLEQLIAEQFEALNDHDVARWAATLAEDVATEVTGLPEPIVGREACS